MSRRGGGGGGGGAKHDGRLTRAGALGLCLAAAIGAAGCSSHPTSVLVHVDGQPDLLARVRVLFVSVYADAGRVVNRERAPARGFAQLPDSIVLFPSQRSGELRIDAAGSALGANNIIAEGFSVVTLRAGEQVSTSTSSSTSA